MKNPKIQVATFLDLDTINWLESEAEKQQLRRAELIRKILWREKEKELVKV